MPSSLSHRYSAILRHRTAPSIDDDPFAPPFKSPRYESEDGTMKALIPTGNVNEMVRFADVAEPAPLSNETVVAVEAFSINRGETFLLERPRAEWRPGKDVVGRIVAAAKDGTGPAVGTRVVAHPPANGWEPRAGDNRLLLVLQSTTLGVDPSFRLHGQRRHGR